MTRPKERRDRGPFTGERWLALAVGLLVAAFPGSGCGGSDGGGRDDDDAGRPDARAGEAEGLNGGDDEQVLPDAPCGGELPTCDLLDPDGCAAGKSCQFLLTDKDQGEASAHCFAAGRGEAGEACDGDNPCAPGLGCNGNSCAKYCCHIGSSADCSGSQRCLVRLTDQNGGLSDVGFCADCAVCSPLTAAGCSGTEGCYPLPPEETDGDDECRLCLSSTRELDEGRACTVSNDCRPGLGCYGINGEPARCHAFCDLDAVSDPCLPSSRCRAIPGDISSFDRVGLCIPAR